MKRKARGFLIALCVGVVFSLILGTIRIFGATGKNPSQGGKVAGEQERVEVLPELPILVCIGYPNLERSPVKFYHDKHTNALIKEGCGICHPENKNKEITGQFTYSYPKVKYEKNKESLMNSYHTACIGCHKGRIKEGKKGGPVTCGECHIKKAHEKIQYLAIKPEYYQPAQDIYHQDCLACHKQGEKLNKEAKPLPWGDFYLQVKREKECTGAAWPQVQFDYYLHYKHDKALEKKCELCHHIYSEKEKKLIYKKGTESSCRDCHKKKAVRKTRSYRDVTHGQCISCHMERKKEGKEAGPFTCGGCHSDKKQRTVEEMADVPRQDLKQKNTYLIGVDDATLKEVPFDHKAHQGYTKSCRDCHHETMNACKKCHSLKGDVAEGGGVTLAEAYHEASSKWSCIGCHESKKAEPSCGGCHYPMKDALNKTSSCIRCHRGGEGKTEEAKKLPAPEELLPEKLEDELRLSLLEKEYQASKFPHLRIIKKLTDISNESKLARYFHTQRMSMCIGCHHYSPIEEKKPLATCSTCHSIRREPRKSVPTLFGAYHRQCVGCHEKMQLKVQPRDCTKCHEEKPKAGAGGK